MVAEDTRLAQVDRRAPAAPPTPHQGFRPDVEGLRAVAVGLVLLYHAGLSLVPGGFVGVDVFFVISGFLITGLLIKEVQRSGTISLPRFYARRAKRLLPAAAVVLAVTAALTILVIPRARWADIGGDIAASALYFVNWRLASNEVNYLAEDNGVSPVQHFWSLAVEEQFYFVWPVLLLVAALMARRLRVGLGKTLGVGLALIAVPSFAWSLYRTAAEPASAFFVTTTRMWELAIGALLAIGISRLAKLPRTVAIVLGWSGLGAIGLAALVYSTGTAWPGYAALLPTLGTAAVIAAGQAAGAAGPVALLGTPTFTWVGALSYSLYLWHWPLIVAATVYLDGLSTLQGLAVAAFSVVPAWLTMRLIENPIRFSPRFGLRSGLTLRLGALLTACGVLIGAGLIGVTSLVKESDHGDVAGAAVLGTSPEKHKPVRNPGGITPDPLDAEKDVPDSYGRGCQADPAATEPVTCSYGDTDGEVDVAVVGDSKALQWISAIDAIGEERGWKVRTLTKSSCPFVAATVEQAGKPYTACAEWGRQTESKLLDDPPDVVLTSQVFNKALKDPRDIESGMSTETMVDGLRQRWSRLTDAGIAVAVLRDNPSPAHEVRPVFECVDENREDVDNCAFPRDSGEKRSGATAQLAAAKGMRDVDVVDLNDYICPDDECPPVIGDVLVYRQGSHLTDTYVETLAPQLEKQLARVIRET